MSVDDKIIRMFLETSASHVNEIVILPAVKFVMKKIVNKLQNKRVNGRIYNGTLNGVQVSVIRSLVGAPNAATILESLKRSKAKLAIRIDFCGGVGEKINIGDILIPKLSYCGEGTSPYYLIKHPEIKEGLKFLRNPIESIVELQAGNQHVFVSEPCEELKKILLEQGTKMFSQSIKEVDFWTTDALFCETEEFVEAMKKINVNGIDMENSIMFLLGKLYDIKVASILSVSDLPGHPKYDLFNSNEIHPHMETGIDNAISILYAALPKIKSCFTLNS